MVNTDRQIVQVEDTEFFSVGMELKIFSIYLGAKLKPCQRAYRLYILLDLPCRFYFGKTGSDIDFNVRHRRKFQQTAFHEQGFFRSQSVYDEIVWFSTGHGS